MINETDSVLKIAYGLRDLADQNKHKALEVSVSRSSVTGHYIWDWDGGRIVLPTRKSADVRRSIKVLNNSVTGASAAPKKQPFIAVRYKTNKH